MAKNKRTSAAKREREQRKRARELKKAQKAALKRERRLDRRDPDADAPPNVESSGDKDPGRATNA